MNVVIIDDNQINLTLVQHLVSKLDDCEAVPFLHGRQGLDWCRQHDTDLVIVDYMMPELDGIEFMERFRGLDEKQDVPVLMITANTDNAVRYRALRYGPSDFLTKPIDKTEFLYRCRNMLALRRNQKQLSDRTAWLTDEVRKAATEILARERETILRLSKAAEYRDPGSSARLMRFAHYCRLMAVNLNLSEDDRELLFQAAPMYDVGKLGTPESILHKPGRLTDEEFEVVKRHTEQGFELLAGSDSKVLQAAAEIAYAHHEKWDGTGYPQGLQGEAIPLFGRIAAVADVFDALTSERPYKPAWPVERAAELIKSGAGQHFDPACVDAFFADWNTVLAVMRQYRN